MIYTTAILCLVSLAQIIPTIPEGTTIFTVTLKDGGELKTLSAAIKARGAFIDSYDPADAPAQLELVLDEPWNDYPTESHMKLNVKEVVVEAAFKRKSRYDESGYVAVESGGEEVWVRSDTQRKYETLIALEGRRNAQEAALYTAPVTHTGGDGAVDSGPGVMAKWGRHVAIVVFALVSIVVVLRVFF